MLKKITLKQLLKYINSSSSDKRLHGLGTITISYADLVKKIGEPHELNDTHKSDAEWNFLYRGNPVNVYNYKTGKNYLGAEGPDLKDIVTWHIGGNDHTDLEAFKHYIVG